jgi:hypothetical protein
VSGQQGNPGFGNGEHGGNSNFTPPVHGYQDGYGDVTVSFGQDGHEDETLIADGHVPSKSQFDGHPRHRRHDHFNGHGGGTDRGFYNG